MIFDLFTITVYIICVSGRSLMLSQVNSQNISASMSQRIKTTVLGPDFLQDNFFYLNKK